MTLADELRSIAERLEDPFGLVHQADDIIKLRAIADKVAVLEASKEAWLSQKAYVRRVDRVPFDFDPSDGNE